MKKSFLVVVILINIMLVSCIPYKDTIYFQNKSHATDTTQTIVEKQKPYRVQINDILNVRVKSLDQKNVDILNPIGDINLNATSEATAYFDGFTVDLHGNIRMPTLGYINVLGFTTEEIEKLIEEKLLADQFKKTANIFVTVKLTGLRYTTSGEIGSPGSKTLFQERVNIFQAVANSGEIPITGNKKDVLIIRQYPQGQKIHHLDLTDVNVMNSPYYYIMPNDIIYVKPLKQKSWGLGTNNIQTITAVFGLVSLVSSMYLLIDRL